MGRNTKVDSPDGVPVEAFQTKVEYWLVRAINLSFARCRLNKKGVNDVLTDSRRHHLFLLPVFTGVRVAVQPRPTPAALARGVILEAGQS